MKRIIWISLLLLTLTNTSGLRLTAQQSSSSTGALEAGNQADIGRDGFDTCAWIARQEWSNGKIATWGPSALGRVQYEYDIYTDGVIAAFEEVRARGGEKARAHSKLIIGPWPHQTDQSKNGELEFASAQYFGMKKTRAFIDYWVKGSQNGFDRNEPPITWYQMGTTEWRATSARPPEGVAVAEYFLHSDRTLSTSRSKEKTASASFKYDPANPAPTVGGHVLDQSLKPGPQDQREKVESRGDLLIFSTPVLEKDLAVTGKVKVRLFVPSDRTDTDFTATLTDVWPDGRSMLVTEGIRRMRFRNTTTKEELIKPGEVYPLTIELTNTAITFPKGHRARLIISSSSYPKFAVNLNDGGPMYKKVAGLVATNNVYFDNQYPSALILPISKR